MERETADVSKAVGEVLLFDSTFGIPDDEAMVLIIESDDAGVVWFGG